MKKKFLGTLLISMLWTGMAFATHTTERIGGMTTVQLSPATIQILNSENITPSAIAPGSLDPFGGIRFPIPDGTIDPVNSRGDIFHTGGLALGSADTDVSMFNLIISTTGQRPVLNGLTAINNNIATRIPIFNIKLAQPLQGFDNGTFVIADITLTLTQAAADTLNNAFGTTAFHENFLFGNAVMVAQSF